MYEELLIKEKERMKKNYFRKLLGIEVESVTKELCTLSLEIKKELLQAENLMHGGVMGVMIDSVIGTAIRAQISPNKLAVTVELNLNYIRPVTQGKVYAEGKVLYIGNRISVGVGEIKDGNGILLATGRATFAIKDRGNN